MDRPRGRRLLGGRVPTAGAQNLCPWLLWFSTRWLGIVAALARRYHGCVHRRENRDGGETLPAPDALEDPGAIREAKNRSSRLLPVRWPVHGHLQHAVHANSPWILSLAMLMIAVVAQRGARDGRRPRRTSASDREWERRHSPC